MNAVTAAEKAAILAHYSAEAAKITEVEYDSATMGCPITVRLCIDSEPMHYQFGTIACDVELLDILVGGHSLGEHLSNACIDAVRHEAFAAARGDA